MTDRNDRIKIIIYVSIILVSVFLFFLINPFGIKMGYQLQGGKPPKSEEKINLDEMLMEYKKQVADYEKFADSDNPTQQKWAETAKEKANQIANEYNKYSNEKLEMIGDIK